MAAMPKDAVQAKGRVRQCARVSERAALIAEIAAVHQSPAFDESGESRFIAMLQDPLENFRRLNPRNNLSSEYPDAAGRSARIRGDISAALARPALRKKRGAGAAAKPSPKLHVGNRTGRTVEGLAVAFEPSADDIASALDGNQCENAGVGRKDPAPGPAQAGPMRMMAINLCLIAALSAIVLACKLK